MAFSAEMTPEKARLSPLACSGPASLFPQPHLWEDVCSTLFPEPGKFHG